MLLLLVVHKPQVMWEGSRISSLIAGAQQTFFAHKNCLWEGRAQVRWEEVEPHKLSKMLLLLSRFSRV